jgi:molybdopterin molybdotransferase
MISYEEALRTVLEHAPVLPVTAVPVTDCAGRALAVDVRAEQDDPPFDRSAMDGFAVRAEDVADTPTDLTAVAQIMAGQIPGRTIGPGECARIMTGAIVPEGADTVVMIEDTKAAGAGRVTINRAPRRGDNICLQGENFRGGECLLTAGETIGPARAGILAALGVAQVPVHGLPTVSVLATGNEIIPVGATPSRGQVRDSNSVGFAAHLAALGIRPRLLGVAPDDREALLPLLAQGLEGRVLAVSAGVSQGDLDLVPGALRELGVEVLFEAVAIKPGKPVLFGTRGDTLVFGLPGNPVSSQVVTQILVLPALRRMAGHSSFLPPNVTALLTEPVKHKPNRRSYLPATLRSEGGRLLATPVPGYQGSGDLRGLALGNALIVLPQGQAQFDAGAEVEALLLPLGL